MKTSAILFSIIFSSLILFNSTKVSFTYAYYELDPVGFIEKLCENKDKPELQCNGKCHLKKVAESVPTESKEPTRLIDFKEIQLFSQSIYEYSLHQTVIENKQILEYKNLYHFLDLKSCFRPPKV